jgi:hypothetical protein
MKRYVCTVATGLLLALVSTGTATASLPLPGQDATEVTSFGDQSVGEQKNDADVTQAQGNGNLNIAPAVGLFGNAETTTVQGSGNEATANVDQSNSVDQSQSSYQKQFLTRKGGECCKPSHAPKGKHGAWKEPDRCCDGQSQTGEQKAVFGDQYVGKQKNDAEVTQKQGNWNGSFAPAFGFFGDAQTKTVQGSWNDANANVDQSNSVDQSQTSYQRQSLVDMCKGLVHR